MASDKNRSNVVLFRNEAGKIDLMPPELGTDDDVCEFIADMLDMLMQMAARCDRSVLVYLLAMARIEALEAIGQNRSD